MKHAAAALAAQAALVLAGCAGSGGGDAAEARIDLTLTLWPTGTSGAGRWDRIAPVFDTDF